MPREAAGVRLDRFLAGQHDVASRGVAEDLIARGDVLVDGAASAKSHRLRGGELVEYAPRSAEPELEAEPMEVRLVHEDEHLLVVDKPAGVVVHPAPGHASGTLVHGLLAHAIAGGAESARPGVVHRLDRDTSGLLVVARSPEAHARLKGSMRRREIERGYAALVRGRPRSWRGRVEAPIGRDRRDPTRQSLDTESPRDAVTHFTVEELLPRHALLTVRLETGRTHQIRVHLAAIELPVAGDPVYGVKGDLGLKRQFLHAARLAFRHPFTGETVDVSSPLPDDLRAALARAREAPVA